MYQKVDTYIYMVGEGNYRLKIRKKSSTTGVKLDVSQNYRLPLLEVQKIRDKLLEEYEDSVKLKKMDIDQKKEIEPILPKKRKGHKKKKKQLVWVKNENENYIYQAQDDKYKYKVLIKKGTKYEPGYFYFSKVIEGTLTDAKKLRDKKLAEATLGESLSGDRGNISLEEFSKVFLRDHCANHSPTTVGGMISKLNTHILPKLGKYKLNKIDTLLLQRFINGLLKSRKILGGKANIVTDEEISTTTANDVYRLLRNILNRAVDWGFIKENPILKVKAPPIADTEKVIFTLPEFKNIINLIRKEPIEDQCLYLISICTGFRRGEVIGLHIDDIDLSENELNINRDIVRDNLHHEVIEKDPKTKKSIRNVPIPDFCVNVILEYLDWRERKIEWLKLKYPDFKETNNMFLSSKGDLMRPEYPANKWKKFIKKNNLKDVTLHGLRHSYCTLQVNENSDLGIKEVQELMGHSQTSTTLHYTHSDETKKKKATSIFDKMQDGKKFGLNQILSICTGRKYASNNSINEILDYVVPDQDLSITKRMEICRKRIFIKYPRISNINDNGVNKDNIFDWLEEQEKKYGSSFYVEQLNEYELERSKVNEK